MTHTAKRGPQRRPAERPPILCVDDEPLVTQNIARTLRRHFSVCTAQSGTEGLLAISKEGPFEVIMSDMRMPTMSGATFLQHARRVTPDTTRLLLTGQTDLDSAIVAVNRGQIFRFLTKPCEPEQLIETVTAAVKQHRLTKAERELLDKTLRGSIRALTDVLACASPEALGRSTHVSDLAERICVVLDIEPSWQLDAAARLSHLGVISLPNETASRWFAGAQLTKHETEMVERVPSVSIQLLSHIPRLEPVLEILGALGAHHKADGPGMSLGAEVVKAAVDFDMLRVRGALPEVAMTTLRGRKAHYDPRVLDALETSSGTGARKDSIAELPPGELVVGMRLVEDVRTPGGMLLVAAGGEVTATLLARLRNFPHGAVQKPVRVFIGGKPKCALDT